MNKTFDVFLCRHRGLFAWLIRFITRSEFDHITLARVTSKGYEFHDFNYPHGYSRMTADNAPWVICSFVCTASIGPYLSFDNFIVATSAEKYSLLFNLNWLAWRLFRWAPFKGWNCVAFVSCMLGLHPENKYLSPAALAKVLKNKTFTLAHKEEDNALSS